jgi:hypothetical protein
MTHQKKINFDSTLWIGFEYSSEQIHYNISKIIQINLGGKAPFYKRIE